MRLNIIRNAAIVCFFSFFLFSFFCWWSVSQITLLFFGEAGLFFRKKTAKKDSTVRATTLPVVSNMVLDRRKERVVNYHDCLLYVKIDTGSQHTTYKPVVDLLPTNRSVVLSHDFLLHSGISTTPHCPMPPPIALVGFLDLVKKKIVVCRYLLSSNPFLFFYDIDHIARSHSLLVVLVFVFCLFWTRKSKPIV